MPSIPTGTVSSTAAKALVVVAFLAVGGVAAAQMGALDGVTGSQDSALLEPVPDGVDSVAVFDASVIESDTAERLYATGYNATVGSVNATEPGEADETDDEMATTSPVEMVPANLTGAFDEVENETGLDPRAMDQAIVYSQRQANFTSPPYQGVIVEADWQKSDVVDAVSEQTNRTYRNTTVDGVTVYKPEEREEDNVTTFGPPEPDQWVAVLDGNEYVFGTEQAVADAVDVEVDDADPVDGDLRRAFDDTRDGYFRYAQSSQNVNVTQINRTMGQSTGLNVTAYAEAYNDLHITSGTYYITEDGEALGTESRILTNSTDTARDVEDLAQGFISIQAGAIQNETLETELRETDVSRDGTTVTVSRETDIETAETLIRWYGSILTGGQSSAATGVATGAAAAQFA
ncbi:hypothetical protein C475_17933 [Halosimplex carlsbadense 2-9-1]|uniref:Uncharacterized protein n=1 Tax=Halosimplex carlsbadense 2-9-1 TaxID=797114 RepID=M0CJ77_9EURY|nr:hypothetical protein [Halosimplex carlsbadense]ELZ22417.1 hypothetical protein C475_17933 [Halosimplex carlsbadense 2-9-1]